METSSIHVELTPNLYADGENLKDIEKIKSLLKSYDWFTMMIDDNSRMKKKEAQNEYIKSELKLLGVNKIVCVEPTAMKSLQRQEIDL